MEDYICLSCGMFLNGNENRRMFNHCPACEQNSSVDNDTDQVSLNWQLKFRDKGLDPSAKREKIELLMNRCLQCEKEDIQLQKVEFPDIN